ncbi:hypothetical protein ACHAWX_001936 [Stephanocyclus meneghinianus]
MSKSKSSLQNYLEHLGAPLGILPAVSDTYKAMNSRIMLIDNSVAMTTADSHLLKANCNFERIEKSSKVSRWHELSQCVEFHAKMAARCWIPTKFRFVNEHERTPKELSICWGKPEEASAERDEVINAIKNAKLVARINPLARQIREIKRSISRQAEKLKQKDQFVSVIICTHGVPTDEKGDSGKAVIKDYVESLISLAQLPVRIVVRLFTDHYEVVDFYASLDVKVECDVLDDYWGEAMEVYLCNSWLTYGIGIHRLREAGLGSRLMDDLDEKPFSLEEIRDFCLEVLVGKNHQSLRNPKQDFNGFIEDLKILLEKEKPVWNPVKNKRCHWVDVNKLKTMYQHKHHGSFRQSNGQSVKPKVHKPEGKTSQRHSDPSNDSFHSGAHSHSRQQASNSSACKKSYYRVSSMPESTYVGYETQPHSPKDLNEVIQQWSHQAPSYKKLKPLEDLLVDMPTLFPPTNSFVESHDYFDKWKKISVDAFRGEKGDELKELLRRASKKSKLFLHPDKLPNDFTDSQHSLFKAVWNVIQESEAACL